MLFHSYFFDYSVFLTFEQLLMIDKSWCDVKNCS